MGLLETLIGRTNKMTDKILKSCNCCSKIKLVKATHNYARCCGGRAGFTALSADQIAERNARRAATITFIESLEL